MIIDIPDKGMKVEFPDDMDMKEVERQIYTNVYDQDVISPAPEKSLLEKGKDVAGDIFQKAIDPWTVSEDEEAFRPDNPPDIDIMSRAAEVKPDQPPEKTILSYAPYMAVKAVKGAMGPLLSPLKTLGMDSEGVLNTAAEYWKKRLPDVGIPNAGIVFDENGELDIQRIDDMPLSEIVGATSEGAGFLGPASVALKGAGLITAKLGQYARPFYRSILKGMIGGALLGEGKKDETLESMAMFGLFEGAGFVVGEIPSLVKNMKGNAAYAKSTIKDKGITIEAMEDFIKNRPKSTPKETLKHFQDVTDAISAIKDSKVYRKLNSLTVNERGLAIQTMDEVIKRNPGMTKGQQARLFDTVFEQEAAPRKVGEGPQEPIQTEVSHRMPDGTTMKGPIHEGAVPGTEAKIPIVQPEAVKPEPVKDLRTGGMTPEIIQAIPDPVVRAFAEGRLSTEKPKAEPKPEAPKEAVKSEVVETETPENIAENINAELPEHGIKYDGEFDRAALKKGPLYQFTPQSGPFKGRTIAVEELSVDAVKKRITALEKEKAVTEPEKGEVAPELLTKKYQLENKIKSLEDKIGISRETDIPGTFVTGREGVPAKRIKKIEAQTDKMIDRAVSLEKLKKDLRTIDARIKFQENAPTRKKVEGGVKSKLEKQFDSISVGDKIDVGGNFHLEVIKKNKKTVVTKGGSKWGANDINAINKTVAPKKKPKQEPKTFQSLTDTAPQERVKREKPLITEAQKKATAKKKAVKETQLKIETAEDAKKAVHSMVRQRRFNLNLSSYETNKFINDIEQVTTRKQREALPFVIEKTSVPKELNRPDLEKAHGENKELLADIAGQVKAHFDKGWKKYKESIGDMSAQEIENYVTHIWEIPRSKKQEVTNWFTTKNRFAKQRYIETLEKGIKELGLKPKVLDIGEIIRIHDAATNKAIENKKLVDDLVKLKKDGVPLIERMDKAPPDWVLINHPSLNKSVFIPGESKMGEKITPELENILYEMGVAIGRRINSKVWGKPSKVAGLYKTGDPPEVRFQRFMENKTIAHEIGHHLDLTLGLGDTFLNKHKTELYALNKDRIEKSGLDPEYTNKTSEQIAEAFAFLFTDPKLMTRVAPTVMTDMLAMLKQDGVLSKLIGFDFEKKAKNLIEEQLNTLTKIPVKVHPDIVRPLKVVFESTDPSEIMQAYDAIAGILKKTSLSLSLFHHLALGETGVATTGPGKVANIYFNPSKIYNALVKGQFDVFKKEAIAKDAIGHGLQMGATSDIPVQKIQGYLNDFAAKTKNVAIVNKATEFLRTFNEKWDTALWDYLHDTLKLYAYESLTVQYVDPAKNAKAQKEEIAQFVNDTFGGQNWDVLMITPKEVQIMTRALLSADWTISTMRQALAPTGIGTIHKGINKPLRRKMGRMFWLKAGLYFGVGINMLNVTFRKADRKENPEYYKNRGKDIIEDSMYGNALGHKSHLFVGRYEDGTERYIRWGKQFRELMEMFVDDSGFSPVSASVKKIGGKANPLLQLTAQITTGHSLSGFKNDDIAGKKGWDFAAGIAKTLLLSPLPFSSRTLMTPNKEFHITDIAMPSSKGMSRYKVMSLFKIAIMKKDDRFLKEVYQDALENNLPAYTLFNASLTSLKAEETREYGKTLKDLKDLREHAPVKTPKEAMILKRKIDRLIKEKKDKMVGIKMLEVAITKAKIYNMEKGE